MRGQQALNLALQRLIPAGRLHDKRLPFRGSAFQRLEEDRLDSRIWWVHRHRKKCFRNREAKSSQENGQTPKGFYESSVPLEIRLSALRRPDIEVPELPPATIAALDPMGDLLADRRLSKWSRETQ